VSPLQFLPFWQTSSFKRLRGINIFLK